MKLDALAAVCSGMAPISPSRPAALELALGLALFMALPGCHRVVRPDPDIVQRRAAEDLHCNPGDVVVRSVGGGRFEATGCGSVSRYTSTCRQGVCHYDRVAPVRERLPMTSGSSVAAAQTREVVPAPPPPQREILPAPPPAGEADRTPKQSPAPEPTELEVPESPPAQEADEPPPEYQPETERPPPPGPSYTWIDGYWWWRTGGYWWVPGYWVVPPAGYVYVSHRWWLRGGVWVFAPGGWALPGTTVVAVGLRPRPVRRVYVRPAVHPRHHPLPPAARAVGVRPYQPRPSPLVGPKPKPRSQRATPGRTRPAPRPARPSTARPPTSRPSKGPATRPARPAHGVRSQARPSPPPEARPAHRPPRTKPSRPPRAKPPRRASRPPRTKPSRPAHQTRRAQPTRPTRPPRAQPPRPPDSRIRNPSGRRSPSKKPTR